MIILLLLSFFFFILTIQTIASQDPFLGENTVVDKNGIVKEYEEMQKLQAIIQSWDIDTFNSVSNLITTYIPPSHTRLFGGLYEFLKLQETLRIEMEEKKQMVPKESRPGTKYIASIVDILEKYEKKEMELFQWWIPLSMDILSDELITHNSSFIEHLQWKFPAYKDQEHIHTVYEWFFDRIQLFSLYHDLKLELPDKMLLSNISNYLLTDVLPVYVKRYHQTPLFFNDLEPYIEAMDLSSSDRVMWYSDMHLMGLKLFIPFIMNLFLPLSPGIHIMDKLVSLVKNENTDIPVFKKMSNGHWFIEFTTDYRPVSQTRFLDFILQEYEIMGKPIFPRFLDVYDERVEEMVQPAMYLRWKRIQAFLITLKKPEYQQLMDPSEKKVMNIFIPYASQWTDMSLTALSFLENIPYYNESRIHEFRRFRHESKFSTQVMNAGRDLYYSSPLLIREFIFSICIICLVGVCLVVGLVSFGYQVPGFRTTKPDDVYMKKTS